jgi:hypothetical protein
MDYKQVGLNSHQVEMGSLAATPKDPTSSTAWQRCGEMALC